MGGCASERISNCLQYHAHASKNSTKGGAGVSCWCMRGKPVPAARGHLRKVILKLRQRSYIARPTRRLGRRGGRCQVRLVGEIEKQLADVGLRSIARRQRVQGEPLLDQRQDRGRVNRRV